MTTLELGLVSHGRIDVLYCTGCDTWGARVRSFLSLWTSVSLSRPDQLNIMHAHAWLRPKSCMCCALSNVYSTLLDSRLYSSVPRAQAASIMAVGLIYLFFVVICGARVSSSSYPFCQVTSAGSMIPRESSIVMDKSSAWQQLATFPTILSPTHESDHSDVLYSVTIVGLAKALLIPKAVVTISIPYFTSNS